MGLSPAFPYKLKGGVHRFPPGRLNTICDVPGVRVAHHSIRAPGENIGPHAVRTGVTVVLPGPGHPFREKFQAAAHVINGFGKSAGLMQIGELGNIETPLVLANTLSVGTAFAGTVDYMVRITPEIGETTGTVNPVVFECNDSQISDLRALAVTEEHVLRTIEEAAAADACGDAEPLEGAVGAGSGMVCYGLKGGFGSASRVVTLVGMSYTLGCLAMTNFGSLSDLNVAGHAIGDELARVVPKPGAAPERREAARPSERPDERGSVIIILATDAPLDSRQLGRIARRAQSGIARTGGFTDNGSGEIACAFSTVNRIAHDAPPVPRAVELLPESALNSFFAAAVSAVEESILSSLEHGQTTPARHGGCIYGFSDAMEMLTKGNT